METHVIRAHHQLHAAELDLRFRVLREPLDLPRGSEWYDFEADCVHVVAVEGQAVVGCVLFHPDGKGGGRLLQMAVEEHLQGQGLGRILVERLEEEVARAGVGWIHLHARDHAVGFYEKLGYEPVGDLFVEVGIPHYDMKKRL